MFTQLANNVQGIINDLSTMIVAEMDKNSAEIIDMNVEQLSEGKNSLGENLPEYKSKEYAKYKKAIGSKSGNRWDLQLEGDYVSAAFTEKKTDYLLIDTKDKKRSKFDMEKPWGLNEKNQEIEANNLIQPIQDELTERFTRDIA